MTALQAAGGGLPLALHMPHIVEQIGAVAGFAAVVGLAILSALYFSQARDLRRLREWAGRAPERAAEQAAAGQAGAVPGRVVAVPQRAPQAVQQAAPVPVASGAAAAAAAPEKEQAAQQQAGQAGSNGAPPAEGEAVKEAGQSDDEGAAKEADGGPPKPEGGEDAAKEGEGKEGEAKEGEGKPEGDQDAGDGADAAKKPGMPAPASAAAAAAGAGAKSASAPAGGSPAAAPPAGSPASGSPAASPAPGSPAPAAAPAGAAAAGAAAAAAAAAGAAGTKPPGPAGTTPPSPPAGAPKPPARPPGSVLPPRTGTVPPVRRIPAGAAAGNPTVSQAGVLGQAPGKPKRNPVYVVLAVMGVLILGAGAAIGVPKLVNGGSNDNSTTAKKSAQKSSKATKTAPLPTPTKDITVAVLNGTTVPGLAAQIGDQIENVGFALGTVSNATEHQRANSVAMYAAGHQRDARAVARRLHIRAVEPVDANSQAIAGDATVVVIVGSDQTR